MRFLILSAAATVVLAIVAYRPLNDEGRNATTIRQMHELQMAQVDYYARHGQYAGSIGELAPALLQGHTGGYRFRVTAGGNSYAIVAEPIGPGTSFFADETMVIRSSRNGQPATANSPEVR
jgi:hypothetical protein